MNENYLNLIFNEMTKQNKKKRLNRKKLCKAKNIIHKL